jgi:hypothetical protein
MERPRREGLSTEGKERSASSPGLFDDGGLRSIRCMEIRASGPLARLYGWAGARPYRTGRVQNRACTEPGRAGTGWLPPCQPRGPRAGQFRRVGWDPRQYGGRVTGEMGSTERMYEPTKAAAASCCTPGRPGAGIHCVLAEPFSTPDSPTGFRTGSDEHTSRVTLRRF